VLELAESLRIAIFFREHFALVFRIFTRVAGCCTVAAQMSRLLHQHKVWDDQHLTCCLEAIYASFVQGSSPSFDDHPEVGGCTTLRAVVALGATASHRSGRNGVQEMYLLHIEHRVSVEQVAHTVMVEHL
jgi:hypothetical protein